MRSIRDGCDDTKIADIKTKCGDRMKDTTCESLAKHQEEMKQRHEKMMACHASMVTLKDGCDDTKLADIKAKCGDRMKDATCESIAKHQEQMKACHAATKSLRDGCDDTKLAEVKTKCGDKWKEATCEKIALHEAHRKACTDATKAAAANCDDPAVAKVKEACGFKKDPAPTCDMIKRIAEKFAKKDK